MNTKNYLFPLLLLALLITTACQETAEVGRYDNWRERNEAFIDSLQHVYDTKPGHGGLDTIHLQTDPAGYIFFKAKTPVAPIGQSPVIQEITPLYTDSVSTFYKGANIIGYVDHKNNYMGEVFDGNFKDTDPTFEFTRPANFRVSRLIVGWTEMLQRMKVGERREIYIPWKYGYGSAGSGANILGYSTLIFDVQLIKIEEEKKVTN